MQMIRKNAKGMKERFMNVPCHAKMIDESFGDAFARTPTNGILCFCNDME